jgi:hypothetical protein
MTQYAQQQKRNAQILANEEFIAAKNNKNNAGRRLLTAERKYYSLNNKQQEYAQVLTKRHTEEAEKITEKWQTIFDDFKEDIIDLITYYKSQYAYVPHLKDMNVIYKQKNTQLYGSLKKAVNDSNVASRLANYYNSSSEYQTIINEYLKIIYWIVFAVLMILFVFLGGWRNIKSYAFIMTLIFLPMFLMNPLISFVFSKMQHVAIDYFYLGIGALILIIFSCLSYFNNLALNSFDKPQ